LASRYSGRRTLRSQRPRPRTDTGCTTLPATAVRKLFKPEPVADGIRRIVAKLSPGSPAQIVPEDGRPVALIGPDPEPAAELDRHYRVQSS
jgi:hypothetical protein